MNMKKLATLVSAVALSATVSANAMAKDTIALVVSTLNNPFFVSLKDGAQKEADKLGYNLVVLDNDNRAAIDTGLFGSARLLRVLTDTDSEGVSFALQMDCESISEARRWHDETATLLRDDMFQRWGDKVLFFTTYLKDAE